MKQLSLTSINSKAPLEVSLTPSGTFSFGTEKNIYIVGFVEDYTNQLSAFNAFASGFVSK